MKVSLVVAKGKRAGKVLPISVAQFVIGRHKECHLRASGSTISQHHCAVLVHDDKVLIRDFDSTNGTFLNRHRVRGEQEVSSNDLLELGKLAFRIRIETDGKEPENPPDVEKTDESFIGEMLLEAADSEAGILGLVEDSKCGSTIMKSPLEADEEPDRSNPAPPRVSDAARKVEEKFQPKESPPQAGQADEVAKKIVDELHRKIRAKHNPPS